MILIINNFNKNFSMNQQKITYFFRSSDKFLDFLQRYPNLNSQNPKNEEMFEWLLKTEKNLFMQNQNWKNLLCKESEILILSSEISLCFLIQLQQKNKNLLYNKKFILVGENLQKKMLKILHFTESQILFCGDSIESVKSFLLQNSNFKNLSYRKKILYLRGEIISYDFLKMPEFATAFSSKNFNELIVYNVNYKKQFSKEFINDLNQNLIEKFAFFSKKSFENFLEISNEIFGIEKIHYIFKEIKIFIFSNFVFKISQNLDPKKIFKEIFVAQNLNRSNSLVDLICLN